MELKHKWRKYNITRNYTFNCTLWNWNVLLTQIEIFLHLPFNCTLWNWNPFRDDVNHVLFLLLIVPYGIETQQKEVQIHILISLLIVPYGIETENRTNEQSRSVMPFNCTLWNWNITAILERVFQVFLLIVPYGIETVLVCLSVIFSYFF